MKARPCVLADVVDRGDVRMRRETRGSTRLTLEASARTIVLAQMLSKDFDRHGTVQELVVRFPDSGHSAVGYVADDLVPIGQADSSRGHRWHANHGTQRTVALYFPLRWPASVTPAVSALRSGRAARTPWSPPSAASTPTCRRSAFLRAALRGASTSARAASRRARSPRRRGRASRHCRGGSQSSPLPRGRRGRPRRARVSPPGGQRPQRLPGRRRRYRRQHGAHAARRARRARPPLRVRGPAGRDRPRADRQVGRPRGAAGRARQLRRHPLAADPRRRRGADLAPRRARRPGADRRGDGARLRPRLRLGAPARGGHDPHRGARDGAPDRHRARAHAADAADARVGARGAGRAAGRAARAGGRRRRGVGQARPRPAAGAAPGGRGRRRAATGSW